jgi:hypothetical protein
VAHFLEGLKEEIHFVIALDTICSLALMQEKEANSGKHKPVLRLDHSASKPGWKSTQSAEKGKDHKKSDDTSPKGEDKLASLLSYRKAKGLCFMCGDKWGKGNTCLAQVPLQVVEELMMAFQQSGSAFPAQVDDYDSDEGMELLEVQEVKDQNTTRSRKPTMRLLGYTGKQQALILLDSGSAATFINSALVDKCGLSITDSVRSQYIATDGGLMVSDKVVPRLQWCCQGYTYCRDTKVMQLPMYDIILGAGCLMEHGPMWVDWKGKVMKLSSSGKEVILIGVKDNIIQCPKVSDKGLKGLLKKNAISHWVVLHQGSQIVLMMQENNASTTPHLIRELLDKFKDLFSEP